MMYKMWYGDFKSIESDWWYSNHFSLKPRYQPFSFYQEDLKPKSKFKIEELDFITSTCFDEEDLKQYLLKNSDFSSHIKKEGHIVITHEYRNKLYEDFVIYDDQLLYECALDKRTYNGKMDNYMIKNNEVLIDFIEYIKFLALGEVTRKYLLYPYELGVEIPPEDKCRLGLLTKPIIYNNGEERNIFKELFEKYIKAQEEYDSSRNSPTELLYSSRKLSNIEGEINLYFRKNYKNIRNIIAWEEQFRNVLDEKIANTNDKKELRKLQKIMAIATAQKKYRNRRITKEELDSAYYISYEELEEDAQIVSYKYKKDEDISPYQIENEEIRLLYVEGGVDLVRTGLDIEDINSKTYRQDMIKLGIVKEDNKVR